MKKFLLLFIIFFYCLATVSAVNTYKIDSNVSISHPVRINGFPAPSAVCQLSVFDPDGMVIVDYQQMTNNTSFHNYTVSDTLNDDVGFYNYYITCTDSGQNATTSFQYEITFTGNEKAGTGFIVVYSLLFIAIFAFALYFLLHGIAKGGKLEYDVRDLSVSWGFLFAFLAMYLIFNNYWADAAIGGILIWFLGIIVTTNGFIPIVLFIVSIMFGSVKTGKPYEMFGRKK